VIVVGIPGGPEVVETLVIAGESAVKLTPLLATPDTVTITLPVVAPAGTVTTTLVDPHVVTLANVPLKATVLDPWVDP
jgi:hypothetical protein